MVAMAKKRSRGPGRPAIHGGERIGIQIPKGYEDRIDKLIDLLNTGPLASAVPVRYRSQAVGWAIDAAIALLEQPKALHGVRIAPPPELL